MQAKSARTSAEPGAAVAPGSAARLLCPTTPTGWLPSSDLAPSPAAGVSSAAAAPMGASLPSADSAPCPAARHGGSPPTAASSRSLPTTDVPPSSAARLGVLTSAVVRTGWLLFSDLAPSPAAGDGDPAPCPVVRLGSSPPAGAPTGGFVCSRRLRGLLVAFHQLGSLSGYAAWKLTINRRSHLLGAYR